MRIALPAAAFLVLGTLTGCASPAAVSAPPAILQSSVDSDSRPAFLDTAQTDADRLPADAVVTTVSPGSTRYQGRWDGREYYLAVSGETTVNLISFPVGRPAEAGAGSSTGNVVVGTSAEGEERTGLVYLPQGTAHPPKGWTALSPWVAVRE